MRRAYDYSEYRRWRGELRCHYLCLIPFVNERNVMRLYRRIYHKPKHENTEKHSDGLYHILAPSVIGIFICAVCLCGASWAWFTSTQTSGVANIQTATYTVKITVTQDGNSTNLSDNNGIYEMALADDGNYKIVITADGTASNGYCKIALGGTTYYTPQIKIGGKFVFSVVSYQGGSLKITPQWGTCAVTDNIMGADRTVEFGTKSITYEKTENTTVTPEPQTTPATTESGVDNKTETTVDTGAEKTTNSPTETEISNNIGVSESENDTEPEESDKTDIAIE